MLFEELIKLFLYVVQMRFRNSGINTDEEGVVHYVIRIRQVPRNAMGDVLICGVTQEIAAEKVSGLDAVGFQMCGDVVAGEPGAFPDGDHVTKPGGIGVFRGLGQDEKVFVGFKEFIEFMEVFLAPGDELLEFLELGAADGGLHVRDFEIITDVTVNVFVVIAEGQAAELLAEAFSAGVAFPPGAITIPAPVADGAGDVGQVVVIRGHTAPLSQGDVMSRVEGKSGKVAEGSGQFSGGRRAGSGERRAESRERRAWSGERREESGERRARGRGGIFAAEGVAIVLDEPQVVLFHEIHDGIEMEGHPHRVGHHDGFRLRADGVSKSFGDGGVVAEVHIDENGNQLILQNGI